MKKHSIFIKLAVLLAIGNLSACTSQKPPTMVITSATSTHERTVPADPGAVEYVWEAPMVDVIDVPPGLDPEGTYYRPAHQTVVEIRQGRWQYYRPDR